MYYSSKTEALDQQNISPNYFFEQPTMTQFVGNDSALTKAINLIAELKQNLAFALKLNELLTQQNQQLKSNAQRTTKKVNADIAVWQKKLKEIQSEKQEIIELLEQTKGTLLLTEQQYQQTKREVQKNQRIIYEQKKAYEELQQNYMNQSLNYAGETSINLNKSVDIHYITEIEKQNHDLQLQLKRLNQQLQKNQLKTAKLQKENTQFRKWMASVLGLQKVVQGSQKILMKQISQRVVPP